MKRILFTNAMGPFELGWGEDMFDIFGARLTRGQGVFTLWGHVHAWPLYIIAENIPAHSTVLENPSEEIYREELQRGYDYVAIQIKSVHTPKVGEMLKIAKEIAPESKVIIGGYGVMLLYNPPPKDINNYASYILDNADYICYEEGICFFRKLLGTDINTPITQKFLPKCSATLKGFDKLFQLPSTGTLVALGCPNACEFCSTSAFFKAKKIQIATPEQCFQDLKYNFERSKKNEILLFNMIFDEDFLLDKDYVMKLGQLIREAGLIDKIHYFCFGSIKAVSQYTGEELATCGVGAIWIGFESKFEEVVTSDHAIEKRAGKNIGEVFEDLHNHGIAVASSNILGWDFHTHENIMEDIDYFVSLRPDLYQVSPLSPCPGTKLYGRMKELGRIYEDFTWEDMHLWKLDIFEVKNFKRNEIKDYFDLCHKKLFELNGPTILNILDIMIRGYRTMVHSPNPFLQQRADRCYCLAKRIGPALFHSLKELAPSEIVRKRVNDIEKRYIQYFGEPAFTKKAAGKYILYPALKRQQKKIKKADFQNKSDPPWRITYYHGDGSPPIVLRRRNAVDYAIEKFIRGIVGSLIRFRIEPVHTIRLNDIDDFPVEFKKIEIERTLINYVDEGEGEVILMLHGNPTWSYLYRHFIKDLKKDYRCIALDFLGYGLSDKPPNSDYSMTAHVRRLGKFIEAMNLNNITLICQDWGGIIGLSYAARNKDRFKRLIPMNTTGFLPERIGEFLKCLSNAWAFPYLWSFRIPWLGKKLAMDWNIFLKVAMNFGIFNRKRQMHEKAWLGYKYPFQLVGDRIAIMKSVRQVSSLPGGPLWKMLRETGNLLKNWDIRTQLIWGTKDKVFIPWFIDKFEEILPNHAKTLRIPTASHFLQDDEPEIIVKRIREFMTEQVIDSKKTQKSRAQKHASA